MEQIKSTWTGQSATAIAVRKEITKRWGKEAGDSYEPAHNCMTFASWKKQGYTVKKGEKGISTMGAGHVFEYEDKKTKKTVKSFAKGKACTVFFIKQVVSIA